MLKSFQNPNAFYYGKLNQKIVSRSDSKDGVEGWSANDHVVNGWAVHHQEFYRLDMLIGGVFELNG